METNFRLSRLVRTPSSEIYLVWDGSERVGQVDIHYAGDTIHATIILEKDLPMEEEGGLLSALDDEVVTSYKSRFDREDFVAYVFRGEQISRYTDDRTTVDDLDEEEDGYDEEDEDDEEDAGDGLN